MSGVTAVEVVPGEYRYYLLSTGKSAGTIRQRFGDITHFARTRASLFDLVTGDLVSYLGRGAEHYGWSLEYLKKIRSSFRSFYRWAHKSGLIGADPAYDLDAIRIPRALSHPTPEAVVHAAFQRAPVPVRAMLMLAATEGLRRSEIAALHPQARVGDTIRFRGKWLSMKLP